MALNREIALHWMRAQASSLWRWADGATVVNWARDGATIAFREELEFILEGLAPYGFPSLDAVLLVLGVVSGRPGEGFDRAVHAAAAAGLPLRAGDGTVAEALAALGALPRELTSGSVARRNLVVALFEGGKPRIDAVHASELLERLRHATESAELETVGEGTGHPLLGLRELVAAFARFGPGELERRLRTGVAASLGAPREELVALLESRTRREPPVAPRDLLDALARERRFAGLVRVARRVLAASSVLRRLREESDQPMGGFSDVSNRGSPDRLLVSELAHDADTFALRVANNEALYLRRERPPIDRPRDSIVLLDTGIHLWGWPRIFALAVALALRELRRHEANVRLFAMEAGSFVERPLETVEHVDAILSLLDPSPWPGPAAVRHLRQAINPVNIDEWTLVTRRHRDEEIDALRRELLAGGLSEIHLATVARTGEFCLRTLNRAGGRDLARAHFDLDQLLQSRGGGPGPAKRGGAAAPAPLANLPLLYAARPFPLLVCEPVKPAALATDGEADTYGLSKYGTLLHWHRRGSWARVLAEGLPRLDHLVFSRPRAEGLYFVGREVADKAMPVKLYRVDPAGVEPTRQFTLCPGRPGFAEAWFFESAVVLVYPGFAAAYALEDGRLITRQQTDTMPLQLARDLNRPTPVRVVVFDGRSLVVESVASSELEAHPAFRWTQRPAVEGARGAVARVGAGEVVRSAAALARAAHGGLLLLREGRSSFRLHVAEISRQTRIRLDREPGPDYLERRPLAPVELPPGRRQLSRLVLPQGNAALLDQRGVLTLTFVDPTEPEWSVLTTVGVTTAWRSDGAFAGVRGMCVEPGKAVAEGDFGLALQRWWGDAR